MYRFKEGDIVKIVGPNDGNSAGYASEMNVYKEHLAVVCLRDDDDDGGYCLSIKLDVCDLDLEVPPHLNWYWWRDEWLVSAEDFDSEIEIDISALNSLL